MADLIRSASVPLFDRLVGQGGLERGQTMTPAQLELSIGRELSRLMNTRSRLSLSEFGEKGGSTLDYGIPDFTALSPHSRHDLELLQAAVTKAIVFYEPRLRSVAVKAFSAGAGKAAKIVISGVVTIDLKLRQLNFELQLDPRHGGLAKAT